MTAEAPFDPNAPLPGPPTPWAFGPRPSWRDRPPYHMTEMIAAEPGLGRRLVEALSQESSVAALADAIAGAVAEGAPVILTGCGTSETGAMGAAEILRDAVESSGRAEVTVISEQAFELSLRPPRRGLVIGVSHEGGTGATNAALSAAAAAGARTATITVSAQSPAGKIAEIVVATGELDQSWCHTIGYLSPLLVAAAAGAKIAGRDAGANAIGDLLAAGTQREADAETIAAGLSPAAHLLAVASGADRPAAREFALKVEEATWLPTAYRDLETLLHGHLPATGPDTGLLLFLVDRRGRPERLARARQALAGAQAIGIRAAAILAEELDGEIEAGLTPAGRILVPEAPDLPPSTAALFGTATPFQLVTERLARARGTNPDLIRREDPIYQRAADVSGG